MENEDRPAPAAPRAGGLVGTLLAGRYLIQSVSSEELLGRVYVARDETEKRKVLVKVLHAHLVNDDAKFGRFLREVRATSMVRHPNTIELLDSGTHDTHHFLVMEYFPSHMLEDEMKKGTLPVGRVAHIAAQIASAIGAAHQESVQHRALSPRNVLLLDNVKHGDYVKVRDFGLSKLEKFDSADEASHLTEAGVKVGNTAYMAPEYIERDRFHPKGDLYALGCLMFAMLTGRPPFTGRAADVLTAHVTASPPRPSSLNDSVPPWMDAIILGLLEKSPEDRPGAYQVVQRLEEGIGHGLQPPNPNGPPPRSAPDDAEVDGQRVPYAVLGGIAAMMGLMAVVAGVLIVGGVFLVFTYNVSTPEDQPEIATVEPAEPPAIVVETDPAPEPSAPVPASPLPAPTASPVTPADPAPRPAIETTQTTGRTMLKVVSNRRALVYLNGMPKGYAPLDLPVPPGDHRIAAALPGQSETRQEQRHQVRKGDSVSVTFTF